MLSSLIDSVLIAPRKYQPIHTSFIYDSSISMSELQASVSYNFVNIHVYNVL